MWVFLASFAEEPDLREFTEEELKREGILKRSLLFDIVRRFYPFFEDFGPKF
jgi:hypothetical protein